MDLTYSLLRTEATKWVCQISLEVGSLSTIFIIIFIISFHHRNKDQKQTKNKWNHTMLGHNNAYVKMLVSCQTFFPEKDTLVKPTNLLTNNNNNNNNTVMTATNNNNNNNVNSYTQENKWGRKLKEIEEAERLARSIQQQQQIMKHGDDQGNGETRVRRKSSLSSRYKLFTMSRWTDWQDFILFPLAMSFFFGALK